MAYVQWKLEHTPFKNNTWSDADKTTLTSFKDPIIAVKEGDGRDSFSFKVVNFNDTFDNYFNVNDKVVISRAVNTSTFTSGDILMVGTCKDVPEEESFQKNEQRVEGYNYSETIMEAIAFVDVTNKTIPEAIRHAIENAAGKNPNFKVEWDENNPTLKTDDTPFPIITADGRHFNKPLKKVIEKYSTKQSTGDIVDYYWYVNNQNKFIWRPKKLVSDYTFNVATDKHKNIKVGKDKSGIKNFIILKGGYDPEGNQIQTRFVNWSSVSANGMKYHFIVSEANNAKNLQKEDLNYIYGSENIGDNKYPPSYPYTTRWKSSINADVDGVTMVEGQGVEVNSNSEYVKVLRKEVIARLQREGKRFADSREYGKLQIDIDFQAGTKQWGLGSVVNCTIPSIKPEPFKLRVVGIQYTTSSDKFSLEEDKGTVGKKE